MNKGNTHSLKTHKFKLSSTWSITFVLLAVIILMSILSPYFFSIKNFLNIVQYSSIAGILAVGMTFVISAGGIDISVGSTVTFVGMTLAMLMPDRGAVFPLALLSVAIGSLCGLANGLLVSKLKIVPFIATMGTMEIFKGMSFLVTKGVNTPFSNPDFIFTGRGTIMQIPNSFLVMIIMMALGTFVLALTPFGKKTYAVGANSTASRLAGINIWRVRLLTYVICGACAGISGMILTALNGAGMTTAGDGLELDAIAATVLGGASLQGGKGSMIGTLVGIVLLNTITNGLNLLGVSTYWQMIAKGAILIVAVFVDSIKRK
jgi:ribose/xylose/arabinose/galactoside ABC-type transport system permease subunit